MAEVQEEWRSIPNHPDYEASSKGRVRCVNRRRYLRPGDIVAQNTGKSGYAMANLDGRARLVHRLVCAAFNGPPPTEKHEAAHNNGQRGDNRPDNLRWATRRENMADIKLHGTGNPPRGEKQGRSKLATADVYEIRRLRQIGIKQQEIAKTFGVARSTINAVVNGYNWIHLEAANG